MSMLPVFNVVCFFLGFRCSHGHCSIVKSSVRSKANQFLFYFPISGTKDGGSYDLHRYSHFLVLNSFFPIIAWSVISASSCFLPSCTEHRLWCMPVLTPSSFPLSPWLQARHSAFKSVLPPPRDVPLSIYLLLCMPCLFACWMRLWSKECWDRRMENGLWESGAIGFLCFVSTIGWRGCMGLRDFFF